MANGRIIPGLVAATAWLASTLPAAHAAALRVEIDPARSTFAARTGTAGVLGFLGHPHGIRATAWNAEACIDPAKPSVGDVRVTIETEGLEIDTAEAFASAGIERKVDEEERADLQEQMLDVEVLDAETYPRIVFQADALQPSKKGLVLEGTLELHGVTRPVEVPLTVTGLTPPGPLQVRGELEIRLTEFGIEPESVGGVVRVADRVQIRFDLEGRVTDEPCPAEGARTAP